MDAIWKALEHINYSGIPIGKIVGTLLVLLLMKLSRKYVVKGLIRNIERFTRKTNATLDNEIIEIIKPSLRWIILIGGIWAIELIWIEELGVRLSGILDKLLNYLLIFIIGYVVYRGSALLGQLAANVVLHTETELDDLLKPLMPKIFQTVAIMVLAIKVSEVFMGQSAGALVGLLGGAGITIGLLFKDIVYDWFCTIVVYSDSLYREGDWLKVTGIDGWVEVNQIGFRTTTLHVIKWGSLLKIPNSKMISGIVNNWSQYDGQEQKCGINLVLSIDHVSSAQMTRICSELKKLPSTLDEVHPFCNIRFSKIEQNARTIEITVFAKDRASYFNAETQVNIAILELLERQNIDFLSVHLNTELDKYKIMEIIDR
jgi:MscS family membrane protein